MLHAVEGFCPHCGSNESIDVVEIDKEQDNPNALVGEWYFIEHLHCNKCGTGFDQDYETMFVGQYYGCVDGWGSRNGVHLPPLNGVVQKAKILVRDLEAFIEGVDLAAEHEDGRDDDPEWCEGYRTELGMRKAFADDPQLSKVRQDLLFLKCYLGDGE